MKQNPFILALVCLGLICGTHMGIAEDITVLADSLVDSFAKNEFNAAVSHFDENMKKALPTEKLKEAWGTIQTQMGSLKLKGIDRIQKIDKYDVVFVKCQFAKGSLETKVVFNAEKRISGLFFLPAADTRSAPPPSYALPDRFKEIPVEIGTGPWKLPGLLTMPVGSGSFPALVLVHGSGPSDRDETVEACKPFRDIAQGLSSRGIAVLRYDKRTLVHMDKILANPIGFRAQEESVDDALEAVTFLHKTHNIDPKRVFVLGHSFGGMLVPKISLADPRIAGFIIMAGATRPLEEMVVEQMQYLASLEASPSVDLKKRLADAASDSAKIKSLKPTDKSASEPWILGGLPGYWLDLREYHPLEEVKKLTKPLLIIQGERDYQVTTKDFANWKTALAKKKEAKFISYPLLNHLFMKGEGRSTPEEYQRRENVAESVIKDIEAFLLQKK